MPGRRRVSQCYGVLVVLIVLTGFMPVPTARAESIGGIADAEAAVMEVLDMQARAWNNGDLNAFMAGYLDSPDTTYTSGGTIVHGYDALMKRYQDRYGNDRASMGTLSFSDVRVEQLGADFAYCSGLWFLRRDDKPELEGVFTLVWRRTPAGWRIIHDHTSLRQ